MATNKNPITKDEIIRTLNDIKITVEDIEKSLSELVQIDMNEYKQLESFGTQIKEHILNKFKTQNSISKITSSKNIIDSRTTLLKEQITKVLQMLNTSDPNNFNPSTYLVYVAQIVSAINDITKEVKGIDSDLSKDITTNAVVTDCTKIILELIETVRNSNIQEKYKDEYVKDLWNKLWVSNNGNPLESTTILKKIKIFNEQFYIQFLENITNKSQFNEILWKKLLNLNFDTKTMYDFFEGDSFRLASNIEQIFKDLLNKKGLKEIVTIFETNLNTATNTTNNNTSPRPTNTSSTVVNPTRTGTLTQSVNPGSNNSGSSQVNNSNRTNMSSVTQNQQLIQFQNDIRNFITFLNQIGNYISQIKPESPNTKLHIPDAIKILVSSKNNFYVYSRNNNLESIGEFVVYFRQFEEQINFILNILDTINKNITNQNNIQLTLNEISNLISISNQFLSLK